MISLVCGNGKLTKQLSHMYFFTIARAFAPHLDLITKRDRAGKTSASDELSHKTKKKRSLEEVIQHCLQRVLIFKMPFDSGYLVSREPYGIYMACS